MQDEELLEICCTVSCLSLTVCIVHLKIHEVVPLRSCHSELRRWGRSELLEVIGVYYLDCDDGFTNVCVCSNPSSVRD